MFPLLLLAYVVAVKVFKKTTPNGKVTVYLGKRDFIDHSDHADPIDGIVVVDSEYLKGRKLYGQVTTTYRYGREEDEVMGVKFSKALVLAHEQLVPSEEKKTGLTPIQERLMKKLGPNAYPFTFKFPPNAPSSVTLQTGDDDTAKPLGVEYNVKAYVADNPEEKSHKRSSISLAIKKLQHAPSKREFRLPSSVASKGFTFSDGRLNLEVTLDKHTYYHGERLAANVVVTNNSRKSVRNIKVYVVQHCEITMVKAQYSRNVASMESREGCPITPGTSFTKVFYLLPLAASNKDKHGIALDGYLKDDDVNLASSTLVAEGKSPSDSLGIVISYTLRVKLNCGTLGGELVTDVPLKLLHPAPGTAEREKAKALEKSRSIERSHCENPRYVSDDEDIVFEDFARFSEPE
ncbi:arrestin homolog [Zootermopsis nevadensis]|uniref:Arrestin-like protein n=1 Tax=Zootermopsis nevadensis TaxID=136037 RepID=A0A067R126_ZOONE|nr:arrestin homolog [Zootermopsis nevadensis]KDR12504.1 Arrestin-like protein [Zootermopsis nevadensis]